jgi:xylose isomerase
MDTFALGLLKAAELISDGRIDGFISEKYSSFTEGIGLKIVNGATDLEELSAYAENLGSVKNPVSGNQEKLQSVLNQILFN